MNQRTSNPCRLLLRGTSGSLGALCHLPELHEQGQKPRSDRVLGTDATRRWQDSA